MCLTLLGIEITAKAYNLDVFEESEDDLQINENWETVKKLKEDLALKDLQLESMKSRIKTMQKISRINAKNMNKFKY